MPLFNTPASVGYGATSVVLKKTNDDDSEDEREAEKDKRRNGKQDKRENQKDPVYGAVMQVVDATLARRDMDTDRYKVFRWVFPLVVTTAELYECSLDDLDEPKLAATDVAVLRVKRAGVERLESMLVYIVREPALPAFLAQLESLHHEMHRDEELLFKVLAHDARRLRLHKSSP